MPQVAEILIVCATIVTIVWIYQRSSKDLALRDPRYGDAVKFETVDSSCVETADT